MINVIKQILSKNKRYYLAVSMGLDSVAAYHWMIGKGYKVSPVHFNHKLRSQNDLMENNFYDLCKATNSKPIIGYGENLKTEAECREARINFYNKICKNEIIITAHHLNDYVESYLLNCFRGHPNKEAIPLESQFENFKIIHPFLLTTKKDFKQYVERNNCSQYIVEDETNNFIKGSRRNWVRSVIIPEMNLQKLSLEKFAKRKINKQLLESIK